MYPAGEDAGLASLARDVYHALTKTSLLLDDLDRRLFAEQRLSVRQFWALQHLSEHEGRSMVELGQLLLTDKSNVTGIVDRLEREGLAMRTPSTDDRRVVLITLTSNGRELRNAVGARHQALVEKVMGPMGAARLHDLLGYLGQISRNLEAQLESCPRATRTSSG